MSGIWFAWSSRGHGATIGLFHGALLLSWRKRFLEFSIDEKIAQDATWGPSDPIGPALDTGGVFFVNEDAPGAHEVGALSIMRATGNMMQDAGETGLEKNQSVLGGGHIAGESGFQHGSGAVHHGG